MTDCDAPLERDGVGDWVGAPDCVGVTDCVAPLVRVALAVALCVGPLVPVAVGVDDAPGLAVATVDGVVVGVTVAAGETLRAGLREGAKLAVGDEEGVDAGVTLTAGVLEGDTLGNAPRDAEDEGETATGVADRVGDSEGVALTLGEGPTQLSADGGVPGGVSVPSLLHTCSTDVPLKPGRHVHW